MTCPVLLIHLSNITGLHEEYSPRTMKLLVFDQGTILCGTTAAMSTGPVKIIFFVFGLCFGSATFYTGAPPPLLVLVLPLLLLLLLLLPPPLPLLLLLMLVLPPASVSCPPLLPLLLRLACPSAWCSTPRLFPLLPAAAANVYIESYHLVPKGLTRRLVVAMAWTYFLSWPM